MAATSDVVALFSKWRVNPKTDEEWNLYDKRISDDQMQVIAKAMGRGCPATKIYLGANRITDHSVGPIADALAVNGTLKELSCSYNAGITDAGFLPLFVVLADKNRTLEKLFLSGNPNLTDKVTGQAVLEMLRKNPTITYVGLRGCTGISKGMQTHIRNLCEEGAGRVKAPSAPAASPSAPAKAATPDAVALLSKWGVNPKTDETWFLGAKDISDDQMQVIGKAMGADCPATTVNLSSNRITDRGLEAIADALAVNVTLKYLYCGANKDITDTGVVPLFAVLADKNHTLKELGLSYNKNLTDKSGQAVVEMLRKNPTITYVNLVDGCTGISNDMWTEIDNLCNEGPGRVKAATSDVVALLSKWRVNPKTDEKWILNGEGISDDQMQVIAKAMGRGCPATNVRLGSNRIADRGVEAIADALAVNVTLKQLSCSNNGGITDAGVVPLCAVLADENRTLEVLYLGWNEKLTDKSGQAMVEMLRKNPTMTNVFLRGCTGISDVMKTQIANLCNEGPGRVKAPSAPAASPSAPAKAATPRAVALLSKWGVNPKTDEKWSLKSKGISDDQMQIIAKAIGRGCPATFVNLSNNRITDPGVELIADALAVNNTMKRLDCGNNPGITDAGVVPLCAALADKNRTLEKIYLDGLRKLTDKVAGQAMLEMLRKNPTITHIQLPRDYEEESDSIYDSDDWRYFTEPVIYVTRPGSYISDGMKTEISNLLEEGPERIKASSSDVDTLLSYYDINPKTDKEWKLYGKYMSDDQMQVIGKAMASGCPATTLEHLDCSDNPGITDAGVVPLCAVLADKNRTLKKLSLQGLEKLTDKITGQAMVEMLRNNPTITHVNLDGCTGISDGMKTEISNMLKYVGPERVKRAYDFMGWLTDKEREVTATMARKATAAMARKEDASLAGLPIGADPEEYRKEQKKKEKKERQKAKKAADKAAAEAAEAATAAEAEAATAKAAEAAAGPADPAKMVKKLKKKLKQIDLIKASQAEGKAIDDAQAEKLKSEADLRAILAKWQAQL